MYWTKKNIPLYTKVISNKNLDFLTGQICKNTIGTIVYNENYTDKSLMQIHTTVLFEGQEKPKLVLYDDIDLI